MGVHSARKVILVIDDDRLFCDAVSDYLRSDALEVLKAHTGADALDLCACRKLDIVLLDQKLPDGNGYSFCPGILKHNDQVKIIFITAYPSFENAVTAIRNGAYDYLSKPLDMDALRLVIEHSLRTIELEKVEQLQKYWNAKESEGTVIVGGNGSLSEVQRLIEVAAGSDAPVLITGETGTGKTAVAKAIHYNAPINSAPFVGINCASLPEHLVEVELFGCEKGAFTGAVTKKGIFEVAEGGTLLLDEIGEMPIHLQPKLLGVLEDRKVRRLGSETLRPIDVRIIAATNKDLGLALEKKTFREDLYYRLSVIRIHVPPLRERREDIPLLCEHFIEEMAKDRDIRIQEAEMEILKDYAWPGNVRELKNILERAVLLERGTELRPSKLLGETLVRSAETSPDKTAKLVTLKEVENRYLKYAFETLSRNYTRTARSLGISLSTLKKKVKEYGLK